MEELLEIAGETFLEAGCPTLTLPTVPGCLTQTLQQYLDDLTLTLPTVPGCPNSNPTNSTQALTWYYQIQ